jgi:hypothetical protein
MVLGGLGLSQLKIMPNGGQIKSLANHGSEFTTDEAD